MEIIVDSKNENRKVILQKGIKYYFVYHRSDQRESFYNLNTVDLSNKDELLKFVKQQDGFFRIAIWNDNFFFGAVDQVASKSILYRKEGKKLFVYLNPPSFKKIDHTSLKDIYYSGYTLNNETIYKNIKNMMPGDLILCNKYKNIIYKWNYFSPNYIKKSKKNFEKIIEGIFQKIKKNNLNKKFLVPLSSGYDSRLIVSLMKYSEMEFETFTYGFKNQRDFKIAGEICNKLNIKNHQVVMDNEKNKIYFSKKFKDYLNYENFGISANNFGDFGPLNTLKNKINRKEFMIINGQSGDFLTGGHLPCNILYKKFSLGKNKSLLFNHILNKHYNLWSDKYYENKKVYLDRVQNYYFKKCKSYNNLLSSYEIYEFENRQCKWVIGQQKVYDYFGYSWELPLWKKDIMDFFEDHISLNEKINQKFYKNFLINKNYVSIWKGIKLNPKMTFPLWLNVTRLFFKVFFLFIGKNKWHKFEKKYIEYFLDPTGVMNTIKYIDYIRTNFRPRNSISIISKKYFNKFIKK